MIWAYLGGLILSTAARQRYLARLHQVIAYIDAQGQQDDLTLEHLSQVASLSKFHFQRQFSAQFGISVAHYIQLSRLKRAAYHLAFRPQKSVLDVALDSGYQSPESFARTFKQLSSQSPSEFRKQPAWPAWQSALQPLDTLRSMLIMPHINLADVTIINVPTTRIAVLAHHGEPVLLGDSIRRFIAWRKQHGLPPASYATYNLLYNDPKTTPAADFRLDLAVATEVEIPANESGIYTSTIPAGRCAYLRHIGSEESLVTAFTALYRDWLPDSGEELRDFPLYLQRIAFFPDVAENEAMTDIFLPLR